MSQVPTLLEADVLLDARRDFHARPDLQIAWGVAPWSTAAQKADAEFRYTAAALRDAKSSRDWPVK